MLRDACASAGFPVRLPVVGTIFGVVCGEVPEPIDFAGAKQTDGKVGNVGEQAADAAAAVVDAVNPFSGWQSDVLGIGLKLAITGAALVLVVAGVRATVNDKN